MPASPTPPVSAARIESAEATVDMILSHKYDYAYRVAVLHRRDLALVAAVLRYIDENGLIDEDAASVLAAVMEAHDAV